MKILALLLLPCLALAAVDPSQISTPSKFRPKTEAAINTGYETKPRLSEYYGAAYNIFTGNPDGNSADLGFHKNLFSWTPSSKLTPDLNFNYPPEMSVLEAKSCSRAATSQMYTGIKGYHNSLKQSVTVEGGYDGLVGSVSFTASAGFQKVNAQIVTQNKVQVITQEKCLLYQVNIPSNPPLSNDFKEAVQNAKITNGWETFIQDWGTHYAKQLVLGASVLRETTFDKTTIQSLQSFGVDVQAGVSASYGAYHGSASTSTNWTQAQQNYVSYATSTFTEFYTGVTPSDNSTAEQWALKLQGVTPLPITFTLGYIGDVIYTPNMDRFDGRYSTTELQSMKKDFEDALKKLASTLTPVPSVDPFLPNVTMVTAHSLTYGGYAGGAFEDEEILKNPLMRLKAIEINYGSKVDGLKLLLSDGVSNLSTGWHGGTGGTKVTYAIPTGKRVAKVVVWSGTTINGLKFYLDDDTSSELYGKASDTKYVVPIFGHLTGLKGRSGSLLDAIGFISNEYSYDFTNPKSVLWATARFGGSGGGSFEDYKEAKTDASPVRLEVRWNSKGILGVKLIMKEGSESYGNNYGASSGDTLTSFDNVAGIKSINIWSGSRVDALQIVTSTGTSVKVGGTGGGLNTINVPTGATLVGLYGRSGSAIDALGFVFTRRC